MLTPISRHPAAAHAACLLLHVAEILLPGLDCNETASRRRDRRTIPGTRAKQQQVRSNWACNIESNSIDVDAALGLGGNCGAVARAALFDNFFMQRFLLAFSSLSPDLPLLLLASSFASFLSMLQVQHSGFSFWALLTGLLCSVSWRNQTHYVQSAEALSMILLYFTPPPLPLPFHALFLSLSHFFLTCLSFFAHLPVSG